MINNRRAKLHLSFLVAYPLLVLLLILFALLTGCAQPHAPHATLGVMHTRRR